jgi:hypothetical protein
MPLVEIHVVPRAHGPGAAAIAARLREGTPSIHVDTTDADNGTLVIAPTCLKLEDAQIIGSAFTAAMSAL